MCRKATPAMSEPTTVYLSKLTLNPRNSEVQRGMANCHALHQTVMRGFPTAASEAARKAFNVLYRPELDARSGDVTVLIQSDVAPDWQALRSGDATPLVLPTAYSHVKRVDDAYRALSAGGRLRFRLRANPTKRLIKKLPDGTDNPGGGKRVQLFREDEQLAWLSRKGDAAGFKIEDAVVRPDRLGGRQQVGWRGPRERGRDIVLEAVVFDGELTIVDAELFRQALVKGIGSGKAYGFGLLSVARSS